MALLTADDIRYRKFAPTRFREGYDVDEVDDFLEEIIQTVDELTRLAQGAAINTGTFAAVQPQDVNNSPVVTGLRSENAQLQARIQELEAANAGATGVQPAVNDPQVAELRKDNQDLVQHLKQAEEEILTLQNRVKEFENANGQSNGHDSEALSTLNAQLSALQADYASVQKAKADLELQLASNKSGDSNSDALRQQLANVQQQLEDANGHVARLQVKLQQAEDTDTGSLSAIGNAAAATSAGPNQAAAMLSMAQQLHDEYVQKGKNEASKIIEEAEESKATLISEAKAEHTRLLDEANAENKRIIGEAKDEADRTYETLAKERTNIEKKIDELRIFERDYRGRLTQFLEDLLGDISKKKLVSEDLDKK